VTEADRPAWIQNLLGEQNFERVTKSLSGSELQSVLLAVMHARAGARTPAQVLGQYEGDAFCRPAAVDPREALAIDVELFSAAADFEAVELSPVAPLGACSSFALTDQNRVLSALRTTEVVADPTNVLALECARRLRGNDRSALHLATSQRVLRAQPVPNLPGYTPHFRLFVLASGGREQRDHAFTVDSLVHHVRTVLAALDRLERRGYAFGERRIEILATTERAELGDRIANDVGGNVERKTLTHPYYTGGLRYTLWTRPPGGSSPAPLADGGAFDWLARLTSNRRAVYVASGVGSQLIALLFRSAALR
jgi:hypothetical protein